MTASTVDLSDFTLWRNGFPDDVFTELRRDRPLFRHGLTPGVEKAVKRAFWMTTKHRHAVRLHRDHESFTAVDGPLIQPADLFASYPTIITLDSAPRGSAPAPAASRAAWTDDAPHALPMTVIGDIIGIPEQDRPRIFDGFDRILKARSAGARQDDAELFATIFGYA